METKRMVKGLLLGAVLFWLMVPCLGDAAVPQKINYQGYLTDSHGVPVHGAISILFSIYDSPSGGTALWRETQNVQVTNGLYSVNLGDVLPMILAFDTQYYLGVTVGADAEMTPRQTLTSVGYAFRAGNADVATSAGTAVSATTATTAVTAGSATTAQNFTGTLAGDVTGTQSATSVGRIQGRAVSSQVPGPNQVLRFDGGSWAPSAVSLQTDVTGVLPVAGGGTGSSTKNFVDLSTAQTVAGTKMFSGQIAAGNPIVSNVTTGTAPFQVNSTTMVSNLNAEMLGGQRLTDLDTAYQKKYGRVAVVEPDGRGDYTNPATAMADSLSWCGIASAIAPCLLKIMPGFYDLEENIVQMKEYIDI